MLELTPKGFFSNSYVLRTRELELIEFKTTVLRERAEFSWQGAPHRCYREKAMSGAFLLDRGGTIIGRAIKPSFWRDSFELDLGGRAFTLRQKSFWKRDFEIFAENEPVGSIRSLGIWSRRIQVELPDDWPLPYQLFAFWLVLLIWRRESSAAASAS